MPTQKGSIRIFRLLGIDVYLHWAWFLAFIFFVSRKDNYSNYGWSALEVLALFAIVLTHEFGHALACRQVGGKANLIVLWPLGGVAYVSPPQRPGAQLWSIAAGPLVNVALIPILAIILKLAGGHPGLNSIEHNELCAFLNNIWLINIFMLIFNLMPVYPLDGGQILRSLLWYVFGRADSLLVSSIFGLIGVAGLILVAIWTKPITIWANFVWLGIMAAFILMNCWNGLIHARALAKIAKIPRREGFACPSCKSPPPFGPVWRCSQCGNSFDTFATEADCPHCHSHYDMTQCLDCGNRYPIGEWRTKAESETRNVNH